MPASSAAEADEPMSRSERMFVGLVLLCMVDLIWVASSELTGYIFNDLKYDKPYFSTYFKSSLFSSYLVLFAFYRPWQRQLHVSTQNLKWMRRRPRYSVRILNPLRLHARLILARVHLLASQRL